MQTYSITVALSATNDGHMPFGMDEPGLDTSRFPHRIVAAFAWSEPIEVQGPSVEAALELAYRDANIGEHGWAARYREGRQRSMSIGDIAVVVEGTKVTYWQVLSCGFGMMDPTDARSVLRESPWSFDAADSVLTPEARQALGV